MRDRNYDARTHSLIVAAENRGGPGPEDEITDEMWKAMRERGARPRRVAFLLRQDDLDGLDLVALAHDFRNAASGAPNRDDVVRWLIAEELDRLSGGPRALLSALDDHPVPAPPAATELGQFGTE